MTEHIRQFDSLADFVAAALAPKEAGSHYDDASDMRGEHRTEWSGAESVTHAAQMALDGSWSIADKVDALLAEVTPEIRSVTSLRPRRQYDVAGGAVNVGRFLTGDPRCMRRTTLARLPKHGRQITLVVNLGARASVSSDEMIQRGTALVALADSLRLAGIGTTIYAVMSSKYDDLINIIVKIADSTQHVDRETVMFALANPAMLRRLKFAIMEHESAPVRRRIGVGGNYGYSRNCSNELANSLEADLTVESALKVPQSDMVAWIKQTMSQLGVEIS